MTQDTQKIDDIMASMQSVKADDPDMIEKLNQIALKVAEAQGRTVTASNNLNIDADPMDELGCEGCQ